MLRASMQTEGKEVDLGGLTRGFEDGVDIPHAAALVEFAEAVVLGDASRLQVARSSLRGLLGDAGFVDAAAVVAAFHGFVRIADAIGIPYTTAAQGQDVPELREEAGVNQFHRVRDEVLVRAPARSVFAPGDSGPQQFRRSPVDRLPAVLEGGDRTRDFRHRMLRGIGFQNDDVARVADLESVVLEI